MKAIVFPGQGSEYPGMGKDLYRNCPPAREMFYSIDDLLGWSISLRCFNGTREQLGMMRSQQLAVFATSLAAYDVFRERGIAVDYLSGLSLGEYTCLYPAGVLGLKDLVTLIKARADATEAAARAAPASMCAVIGMDKKQLAKMAGRYGFYLANINSRRQTAISVRDRDADRIKALLESLGAKVLEIGVRGGFHSPLMKEASAHFKEVADSLNFKEAKIPIVSNVTGKAHTDGDEIRENLIDQLTAPVEWLDCVEFMIGRGVDRFFEIGPSLVLRGLIKRINPRVKVVNIGKSEDLEALSHG